MVDWAFAGVRGLEAFTRSTRLFDQLTISRISRRQAGAIERPTPIKPDGSSQTDRKVTQIE